MGYTKIAPNMYIDMSEFGEANFDVICRFLRFVDETLSRAIGKEPFSTKNVYIRYRDEGPMITESGSEHVIWLSVGENYWCQWVLQFAHEYCHHIINGPMRAGNKGMMWFEEIICHACSWFMLVQLEQNWDSVVSNFWEYKDGIKGYVYDALFKRKKINENLFYRYKKDGYCMCDGKENYDRNLYNEIAFTVWFPLFLRNPNLWKILNHIGDSMSWKSLIGLLDYLVDTSDSSYRDTMIQCRTIHKTYFQF